jgi:hypothetical protein
MEAVAGVEFALEVVRVLFLCSNFISHGRGGGARGGELLKYTTS